MGLFRSIGRAIGGAFRGISRLGGGKGGILGKIGGFVKKGLGGILGKVGGIANKVLDKLPFGLGKLAKPFVNKFLQNPLGLLAGGPLGALSTMLPGLMSGKGGGIGGLLSQLSGGFGAGGIQQNVQPQGISNLAQLFAQSQAQNMFGGMFR